MSKKWVVAAKRADFDAIAKKFNISPFLARIIRNRDVVTDEQIMLYLNGSKKDMHNPGLLKDIDIAADIIRDAIEAQVRIRIVGDYDIDGVMASYILQTGLEYMGADVDVRLPNRIKDGYGINNVIIEEAAADGIELIITCDNGIAASQEIAYAAELGMTVIVTDHHEIPYTQDGDNKQYILPCADAVIDPKQPECTYPFKGICGAMVAYKLIEYMLKDWEGSDEQLILDELLSFAAFATIGDVMELVDENRIAVKEGLEILRVTSNIGMKALMDVSKIDSKALAAFHIGFILGPCVNASGRLDTAKRALELFRCVDQIEATVIAQELYDLNVSRKNMTVSFADEAIEIVRKNYPEDKVIVVYLPSCHESIAGIVAGRIREKYYRPTIVLTADAEGGVKGSGRSIDNYDMFEELSAVKDLFTKFGGHKMAAGMSLPLGNVEELRRRLNENTSLTEDDLVEKMIIDIPLPIGYVNLNLVNEFDRLAPFGVANAKPLFAQKDIPIKSIALVGQNKNTIKLTLEGVDPVDGRTKNVNAMIFNSSREEFEKIQNKSTISILYQAGINEYMGNKSVSLTIQDYQ